MNTIEVIKELVQHHREIEMLYFYPLRKQQLLQERVCLSSQEQLMYDKAMQVRAQLHLPFWDCILLTQFDNPTPSPNLLKAAMLHHSNSDAILLPIEGDWYPALSELSLQNIGWNSCVQLRNGEKRHIPLIDFHIPFSEVNTSVVKEALSQLSLEGGYILNSGESYHYIHHTYINQDSLITLLTKALFLNPIIDRLWVAHQLLNQSAMLRIGKKHGIYPQVIYSYEQPAQQVFSQL